MVTSGGMQLLSIKWRQKSKSVCEADGKPISISLKPIFTSVFHMRILRSWPMGSMRLWLPSRKSTLHQMGGLVIWADGHLRSGRLIGVKAWYLCFGLIIMIENCFSVVGICVNSLKGQGTCPGGP